MNIGHRYSLHGKLPLCDFSFTLSFCWLIWFQSTIKWIISDQLWQILICLIVSLNFRMFPTVWKRQLLCFHCTCSHFDLFFDLRPFHSCIRLSACLFVYNPRLFWTPSLRDGFAKGWEITISHYLWSARGSWITAWQKGLHNQHCRRRCTAGKRAAVSGDNQISKLRRRGQLADLEDWGLWCKQHDCSIV